MKISIEEIQNAPNNTLEIDFQDYIEELELEEKVVANLTAQASGFSVNISGNISAKVILQCDRCLESYVSNFSIDINEEFVKEDIIPANKKDFELLGSDFVQVIEKDNKIDITDLIYQSIVLNIPQQNLCKPDCMGVQGYELNNSENKNEEYIDERLEVFKSFSENSHT